MNENEVQPEDQNKTPTMLDLILQAPEYRTDVLPRGTYRTKIMRPVMEEDEETS